MERPERNKQAVGGGNGLWERVGEKWFLDTNIPL